MTHSLFLILKILGIILLVLLILILLAVLLVLFVPVRYRFWGEWKGGNLFVGRFPGFFGCLYFISPMCACLRSRKDFPGILRFLGKKYGEGLNRKKEPGEVPGEESFLAGSGGRKIKRRTGGKRIFSRSGGRKIKRRTGGKRILSQSRGREPGRESSGTKAKGCTKS